MKHDSPAFQWYPKDYLSSARVAVMSLEEEGAYLRALNYCWLHGSIPADPKLLARLIGKGCSEEVARVVQGCFDLVHENGTEMVHSRIEEEREKQNRWREKSAAGGKKSAQVRRRQQLQRLKGGSTLVATKSQPKANISSSSSYSNTTESKDSSVLLEREPAAPPPAREPDPPEQQLPVVANGLNAVEIFETAYPHTKLTLQQKTQIRDRVRDGPRWLAALEFWRINAYRPQSIGKLLEKYEEIGNGQTQRRPDGRKSNADIIREQQVALEPLRGIDPIEAFRIRD